MPVVKDRHHQSLLTITITTITITTSITIMILKPPDSVHNPLERGGNYNDKGIGGAPALCAGTPGDVVTPSFHNISPESH